MKTNDSKLKITSDGQTTKVYLVTKDKLGCHYLDLNEELCIKSITWKADPYNTSAIIEVAHVEAEVLAEEYKESR